MNEELQKLPAKFPLEQFDVSVFSKDKIRELYRSGKIPTADTFVDEVILRAAKQDAADIHFEPIENELRIRIGIEGALRPLVSLPKEISESLANVLKTKASLNAFEKKKPQEGRFSLSLGARQYDVRINTVPMLTGERVALRLLPKQTNVAKLEELDFSVDNLARMQSLLARRSGLMLVTGPSGSGKSTTVYAGVNSIQSPDRNIMTVEDPVEYKLEYASQVAITGDKTITYADAIRSILRQNPNVILIGEIRDAETGIVAAEAAVTGSLVLSTMLSNEAIGTVHRLLHLGIPSYSLVSALSGVVHQVLVKRICRECRQEHEPETIPPVLAAAVPGQKKFHKGSGCGACRNTGYLGRLAVHEILIVDDRIRDLIYANASGAQYRAVAREAGFEGLVQDAAKKVSSGLTTVEEFQRAFG